MKHSNEETRRAIVTGSDSGIGEATAVVLARHGYDVGITWHADEGGAREVAAKVEAEGRRAPIAHLDLSEPRAGAGVIDELADALGGLDVLVNNAGTGGGGPFLETSYEDWRHVLAVDLDGPFVCSQRAARRLIAQGRGGRIINVTSIHEHVPLPGAGAYCAAKGGLGLLTKVMALELAEYGITVNAIAPGEIATPMTGADDQDPHALDRPRIPVKRPGHAEEMANVIAFLASPDSSYMTGASVIADGGLTLMAVVR